MCVTSVKINKKRGGCRDFEKISFMSVGRDGSVRRVRAIGRLFRTDDDGEDVFFSVFFFV